MLEKGTKCVVCGQVLTDDERGDDGDDAFDRIDPPRICLICWECPKCGNDGHREEFCMDEGYANCSQCGAGFTIKEVERKLAKRANRVKCPHCKGSGFIAGKKIIKEKKNA